MDDEAVEQTLWVGRGVSFFKIPPRASAAAGHKSGDWQLTDKIFSGRVRVMSKGSVCEIRIEDPDTGDLFALCPIPKGERNQAVEPAADSSRNFVLRLVDPNTHRHAFIGMSFAERAEAFDFNVALADHEKHVNREQALQQTPARAADIIPEAATLYRKQDLSLKEGQTMHISVKRPSGDGQGFLSKLAPATGASGSAGFPKLMPLAPPPASQATYSTPAIPLITQQPQPQLQQQQQHQVPSELATQTTATSQAGWATF